ncbi:PadR family transcriptional regulator [Phenylobacterium sp.]|uniref:PadR family transcriptional regulator n=1 Tax=Phenylobacterium sp. TaxID=1871053 RepID=UPI002FE391CF
MRHMHRGGRDRHFTAIDEAHGHHHRGRHGGRRRGGRLFDYGEFRLLILAMLAERPRHGYELIKGIEEQFGGAYTPSPGVIYPTLAWLDDSGYAAVEAEDGGRKRYTATAEGLEFLAANRPAVDALLAWVGEGGGDRREGAPAPVVRGMENLKLALRLRVRRGPIDAAAAEAIAAALDAAALAVERS